MPASLKYALPCLSSILVFLAVHHTLSLSELGFYNNAWVTGLVLLFMLLIAFLDEPRLKPLNLFIQGSVGQFAAGALLLISSEHLINAAPEIWNIGVAISKQWNWSVAEPHTDKLIESICVVAAFLICIKGARVSWAKLYLVISKRSRNAERTHRATRHQHRGSFWPGVAAGAAGSYAIFNNDDWLWDSGHKPHTYASASDDWDYSSPSDDWKHSSPSEDWSHSSSSDFHINPATGLPMVGEGIGGFDVGGDAYGTSFNHDELLSSSFDDSYSSFDDNFSSFDDSYSSFDDSFSSFDDSYSSFDDSFSSSNSDW